MGEIICKSIGKIMITIFAIDLFLILTYKWFCPNSEIPMKLYLVTPMAMAMELFYYFIRKNCIQLYITYPSCMYIIVLVYKYDKVL